MPVRSWTAYYVSRTAIAAGIGLLMGLTGLSWWLSVLAAAAVLVFFVWAPRSGRYMIDPAGGVAPMRIDERSRQVRDIAARNALMAGALGYAVVMVVAVVRDEEAVSLEVLGVLGAVAALAYVATDFWQRRSG
jgi:hypothetical protein